MLFYITIKINKLKLNKNNFLKLNKVCFYFRKTRKKRKINYIKKQFQVAKS